MSDGSDVPSSEKPGEAPADEPKLRSITISIDGKGQYGIRHEGFGGDPVQLCGLLEVAKSIILDQLGPKKRATIELPPQGAIEFPRLPLPRQLPPGRYNGGGHRR